jgi:hypothetical protein
MPERKLQDLLQAILRDDLVVEPQYYITEVRTFEEAGVPSEERGLVVTMSDGSEFEITIVRRRVATSDFESEALAEPGTTPSSEPGAPSATTRDVPPRSGDTPPDATRNVEGMSPEVSRRSEGLSPEGTRRPKRKLR